MSTKIYDAYILKEMSLLEIKAFCDLYKKKIEKLRERLIAELCARQLTTHADNFAIGVYVPKETQSFREKVWLDLLDRQIALDRTKERDPEIDFGVELTFVPHPDKKAKRLLVRVFAEAEKFHTIFKKMPGVKDFHYQNSTDRPKNVSEKEWRSRRAVWDKVFCKDTKFSDAGFTITIFESGFFIPKTSVILNHVPPFGKRVFFAAKNLLAKRKFKPDGTDSRDIISQYLAFNSWMRSAEAANELDQIKTEITPLLKRSFETLDFENKLEVASPSSPQP